jgi:hypothetical protein
VTLRTSEGVHHERWRATDHTLERDVVLVCFPSDSQVAAAALDAARRAAGVEDPRLVRVLDVGTDGDISFIVEEPLTGSLPMSHLLQTGGLPSEEVRRLVGEAASALEKARHRGLHHLALTPSTILRLSDGQVKLRGLATEAALLDMESASDDVASRLDAVGLVRIVYAGLTARWPASAPEAARPVAHVGLEPAPTMVGGVAAPSEIAVGVPADLDLICRQTLSDDRGPVTPGDLANQIAPWSKEAPATNATTGLGVGGPAQPTTPRSTPRTQVMPRVGDGAPYDQLSAGAGAAGPAGRRSRTSWPGAAAGGPDAGAGPGAADDGAAAGGAAATLSAAGAAAAGVAGAIGDRVGSFARAAADKAATKAAERRAAHHGFDGHDVPLAEALDGGDAGLEPPVPMLGHAVPEAPSGTQSRIALAIVAALVLVALVIGVQNVMKIGQHDGTGPAAGPVSTAPATPKSSATSTTPAPTTTSQAPTSEPPATPISITGASGFDPEGNENQGDGKAKLAFDGDPGTSWESRWFGSANYNGSRAGVGLVLDLDQSATIKEVVLTLPAAQDVTVYAADGASLDGAQEIGTVKDESGTITLKAPDGLQPATTVIVWVTKAAPAEAANHYRAQVSEVEVR